MSGMRLDGHWLTRTGRRLAAIAVLYGSFLAPAYGVGSEQDVDPRLRYQLLSIALEASVHCDWVEPQFEAMVRARRRALVERATAAGDGDAADFAVIRERARRVFRVEGCDSPAIADLVATVRAVERR